MQQDSLPKGSILAKITFGYSAFACVVQAATYLAGAGTTIYFGTLHLAITLIYVISSLYFTVYCLRAVSRAYLAMDAIRWIATLLLTLPMLLAELGFLPPQAAMPVYQWILFPVAAQFFGLMPWMNNMSVFALTVAFSVVELGILSCGAYRRKLLQ